MHPPRTLVALIVSLLIASGCAADSPGRSTPSPGEGVAEVDGQTVKVQDVVDHLSPPDPATEVGAPINPRRQALDAAIRVELFSREAARRGADIPDGPPQIVRSQLVQFVVRQELKEANLPGEVSDSEALRYYEEHPELFNGDRVSSVSVSTLVVEDPEDAERFLGRARGMSEDEFSALASKHSVDKETLGQRGSTVVLVDGKEGPVVERGEGLDEELSAVGWSLRSPGQVGLARDGSGRYHVLRSEEVDIAARTFSEGLAPQVKGVAELERSDQALRRAEEELREKADVTVDEATLYSIPVPTW